MKKRFIILTTIMTLVHITNNMAHPVTPQLIAELGQGPTFLGILFAPMAIAQFFASPWWGRLSDRFGRKWFISLSAFGYGLVQLGFGFSTNIKLIIVFRILAGMIASGAFISALAYIADLSTPQERSKLMVYYTAITGFAVNIGYLLGGFIGNRDYHDAFIAQAGMSFLTAILTLIILKEPEGLHHAKPKQRLWQSLNGYRHTIVPFLLIMVLFTSLIAKGFDIGFNSYLKFALNFNPLMIGVAMAVSGLVGLFTNFILFPFLKRKYQDLSLLVGSICLMAAMLILFASINIKAVQIICLIVFFGGLALYKPLLQAIIARAGNQHGEIMGLNNACHSFGMAIGSLAIGAIYDANERLAFYTLAGLALFVVFALTSNKRPILSLMGGNVNETSTP